jgi:hypothetical protein
MRADQHSCIERGFDGCAAAAVMMMMIIMSGGCRARVAMPV